MMRRAGALVLSLLAMSAADRPAATKADAAAREKAFIALLADSTWDSRWHAFSPEGFTKGGENRYRIVRAQKVKGDDWVIFGGFELEGKPVELPLSAKIFWADDTPVMSMTGLALPGEPAFDVRILFKGDMFSGVFQSQPLSGALVGVKVKKAKDAK